jgi:hypothetical protein
MEIMLKAKKEASEFKNSSPIKLKIVRMIYRFLSYMNLDTVNFFFTFFVFGLLVFFFCDLTILTLLLFVIIHYFFFWKYIILNKKFKLVKDEDGEEIKQVILFLDEFIKKDKNKKPINNR